MDQLPNVGTSSAPLIVGAVTAAGVSGASGATT
jgi:hypothetical protein